MFNILELFPGGASVIHIVDVGAMWLGEEEPSDVFEGLLQTGKAKVVGFEPVEEECAKLNQMHGTERVYLPYAIGDGGEEIFHICNYAVTSSLYEPNSELLDKFQNLENLARVTRTRQIKTHRLDDIEEINDADFLKIDTQGAELKVLAGAKSVLSDAVLVHTEVEFVPMYRDQPLFGDIDQELRSHGFLLHTFPGMRSRLFKPLMANHDPNSLGSQVLWADVVYMKDFMRLSELVPEKLAKLAILLHELYQSFDTAAFVLQECF
jgi:FkbM family methyltransferase